MGNWRTVNITGTMSGEHAAKLLDLLDYGDYDDTERFGRVWGAPYACLGYSSSRPGLCGLGAWPAAEMSRSGNLAERDYSVEDVAGALRVLVHHAPSMLLKVHCGDDRESDTCVATISVGEGLVAVGKPEVEAITGPSDGQMLGHLFTNLMR